ncbi:Uncharacterised protein [Mycobacteroides abscessus subsp. abscessus]|nr:Uncharacterised protein [Mycobacteroides abscessus subsp. abscessus]
MTRSRTADTVGDVHASAPSVGATSLPGRAASDSDSFPSSQMRSACTDAPACSVTRRASAGRTATTRCWRTSVASRTRARGVFSEHRSRICACSSSDIPAVDTVV